MKRILYLSFNDGSDVRINKEVASLCRFGGCVEFVGTGISRDHCEVSRLPVFKVHFITGRRKHPFTLLRYFLKCAWLLTCGRFDIVHVVNEPQLSLFWPFLWIHRHVVADLFDSVFLRWNKPGDAWTILKTLLYAPAGQLLVTDGVRRELMPRRLRSKVKVLPNYPLRYGEPLPAVANSEMIIAYFGWLGRSRGTETISGLLDTGMPLRVIMAGWVADKVTERLKDHPRVCWMGILSREETYRVAAGADFILCVYAPVHLNNICASPNKLYDAIQLEKPVIINSECKISAFAKENRLGYVMPRYKADDYCKLYEALQVYRSAFVPNSSLKSTYTWEQTEDVLRQAHGL